jgi:hypothetical protein
MAESMSRAESAHHAAEPIADRLATGPYAVPTAAPARRREPLFVLWRFPRPIYGRFLTALVTAGCWAVLGIAVTLTPSPTGFGTHEQFHMGACGMLLRTGYPCITCGMTTAFAHLVRGHLWQAFLTQPAGFALGLLTVVAGVVGLAGVLTGRIITINWYRVNPLHVVWAAVAVLFGGWAFVLLRGLATGRLPMH